jgi:hypothetical protein
VLLVRLLRLLAGLLCITVALAAAVYSIFIGAKIFDPHADSRDITYLTVAGLAGIVAVASASLAWLCLRDLAELRSQR